MRDKQINWIEFSSTAATFNKHIDDTNHTTKEFNNTGGLALKLANIHLRKKEQYGSPEDKMLKYDFP